MKLLAQILYTVYEVAEAAPLQMLILAWTRDFLFFIFLLAINYSFAVKSLANRASVNGDSFNICKSSHKEPHDKNTDVVLKFKMTLIQKNKTKHIYMYTKHNGGDSGERISLHQNKCIKKILLLRLSGD